MQNGENKLSRGKFMKWLGIASTFTIFGLAFSPKKRESPKTVRMLTEDGKLVEIDESLLSANRRRVSTDELKSWIKNKN